MPINKLLSFRIKSISLLILILLFLHQTLDAQYKNIKVGDAVSSMEPQECSIVISPFNTNNIMAAANRNNYYYSTDAGLSWKHGFVQSPYGVIGDPGVLAGADGKFYYFHLVNDLSRVVCHQQNSIGSSWNEGTFTGVNGSKQNDKDWGAINVKNNYLYLTWSQFDRHGSINTRDSSVVQLSRSTDEGVTWSAPINISNKKGDAQGGNYSAHAPMPTIGPNNDVYVTWMGPNGLMFDKSTDAGLTWLNKDINVTPYHINWLVFNIPGVQRTPGFPIISCDISGRKYNGNIYICWSDQNSGSRDTDIWMCKSTNGGINWSQAKRVNYQDDSAGAHQFFPWITVDQVTGYVYCIFYDRSGYTDNKTDVTMAYSKDGGETFTSVKISQSPFVPLQSDFIGDYIGISAHNNIVRPIWTRVDNGIHSLWTALVDMPVNVESEDQKALPTNFEIVFAYPNPFNPSTKIQYSIPKEGNVCVKVFDLLGKEIAILENNFKNAGIHQVNWEPKEITSGTYFVNIQFENRVKTEKIIISK